MDVSQPKRVLITGGSSGLGKALALCFANQAHKICIADLNDERGQETLEQLNSLSGEAIYQHCDVTNQDDLDACVAAMKEQWGGIDVVINNAGVASGGPVDWLSAEDWKWIMDINFFGVVKGCQAAIPSMKEQGFGHIVNVASMAGLLNPAGMSNYNVSKAAVISLSETLVTELKPHGIGVTCLCPSFFKTNLGESMRSPDQATANNLSKLMDSSDELTAEDIAQAVYDAVASNQFLLMPHNKARQAYEFKCKDLDAFLDSQERLANSVKNKATRSE